MALDTSRLRPLDTSQLSEVEGGPSSLDTGGLRPLDTSGLQAVDAAQPAPSGREDIGRPRSAASSLAQGVGQGISGIPKSMALKTGPDSQVWENLDRIDAGERYTPQRYSPGGTAGVAGVAVEDPSAEFYRRYEQAAPEERESIRQALTEQAEGVTEEPFYQAGEGIDAWFAENFPTNPEFQGEFWSDQIPRAVGSAFVFLGGSALTRGAFSPLGAGGRTFGSFAGAGGLGSAMGRVGQFEDAMNSGADIETAIEASEIGGLIGLSEAVPIGNLLNRLDKGTGGQIKRYLSRAIRQGGEEAVQESFSGIMNAAVAQNLYDPERGVWTHERAEEGAVGFTTGAILETVMTLAMPGRRRGAGAQTTAEGVPEGAVSADVLYGAETREDQRPTMTAEQLQSFAEGRLRELDEQASGTPESTVTGPDGQPMTAPEQPGQILTPAEASEREFLRQNIGNSEALADGYGLRVGVPQGERERTRAETPPPTPEDQASPIPTDTIQQGKATVQDAVGSQNASQILEGAGFPPVDSAINLTTRDGGRIGGTVIDAFDDGGRQGAKIRLDNGRVVAESFDELRGRVQPAEGAEQAEPEAAGTEAPAAEAETTASVPVMVTQDMRRQLGEFGYSPEDIRRMRPQEAHDIIQAGPPEIPGQERPATQASTGIEEAPDLERGPLSDVPAGTAGVSIEPDDRGDGRDTRIVMRDDQGQPIGILSFATSDAGVDTSRDGLLVHVDPDHRRRGVATRLYDAAAEAGYDIDAASGARSMTEAGRSFVEARRGRKTQKPGRDEATPAREPVARRDAPQAEDTAVTPTGREVPVRYATVEAADLVASQTDQGTANPDYPAELQPRDRRRAVSGQQVQDIANRLNPRLLERSPRAADGAPIIAADGVVESGNGRILAIRRAYAEGLETAEGYRNYLAEQGYPVEGMNQPVLVRVREGEMTPEDRAAFTREANERDTLGMSATERAMADASALPDTLLELYRGGDVDAAANRDFVRGFLDRVVGRNEQAGMIAADGAMSQEAIRRVEGALLAKAYGDADLVATLIESADTNIKAIGGALMDVAANWAQMRTEAQAERIDPAMDQTGRLLEAIRLVQRARREGRNVAELVGQRDMLSGDALHPAAEGFLRLMFRNTQNWTQPAGRDRLADALRFYLEGAERAQPGVDLLGETAPAPERILETARERQYGREEAAEQQQDLLAQPAGRPGERDRTDRPEREERPEPRPAPAGEPETARPGEEGAGAEAVAEPPLRVEDYSDKAIIVRGQTRENIDRIKGALPGRRPLWNKKAQGWIFPKAREADVRAALADLLGEPSPAPTAAGERRAPTQRDIYNRRIEDITDPDEFRAYIEELRTALQTDERTGLGSNRAWLNREPKANIASIDLDSLKWVNDHMGHDAGDRLIAAVGEAFQSAGFADNAFHVSGDEFYAHADDAQQLQEAIDAARRYLAGVTIEGNGLTYTGPGFSYGFGGTIERAEAQLHGDKTRREQRGERAARGERPQGVTEAAQAPEPERVAGDRAQAPADRQGERAERPEPDQVAPTGTAPSQSVTIEGDRPQEGTDDGVQRPVPSGDAPAGAADVQPAPPDRRPRRPPEAEGGRGAADVRGTDGERAEAPERPAGAAAPAGGRGTGPRDPDRVPAGRGERAERPAESRDRVTGANYRIEPGALAEERGRVQKARDNIRAIELMRQIEAEGRPATAAEQAELARYVGWGGLKGAFPDSQGRFEKGLESVGKRLQELLTDTEYATARRSLQYAHYTSEAVVRSMWNMAERLGFTGGRVFEPGMGVGNFAGLMSPDVAAATDYNGLELDHTTARIARLLYPRWGVRQDDFTRAPLPKDTFDLVIGNPPFADIAIQSDPNYPQGFLLHDYFFAKSLDGVRPGGLLAFISSAGTMNKTDASAREYLADRADLVGAVRLPGTAFEQSAGTSVTTDIIILRKRLPDETAGDRTWTETVETTLPGKDGAPVRGRVSRYFADHPEMVLGEEGFFDPLYEGRYAVRAPRDFDLDAGLRQALGRLPENVLSEWTDTTGRAEIDFGTAERKEGSFYVGRDGQLMQQREGVGRPVQRRGKGVEGGRSMGDIERIQALIPMRDALRAVYAADLAGDAANAESARKRLNEAYDAFVKRFGPVNKADFQYRRPTVIQQESARAEAREEARFTGTPWREGDFDATPLIEQGASLSQIARARKEAREKAQKAGRTFDEGSFDPADMPDLVIERRPNVDAFMDDPESYRLRAIEDYNDQTGQSAKTEVFFRNIITREREPEIHSVNDALLHVLNRHGRLDITEVARAAGVSESEAIEQLGEGIYRLPSTDNQWVTRDEYLSGNVRRKLRQARAAAARDPALQRNVDALEAAQPAPLPPSEINANLGMPWIPTEVIDTFGTEALGLSDLRVRYTPALAQWEVSGDTGSVPAVSTWGTEDRPAPALIQDALNRQDPRIYREVRDADGQKRRELDTVATEAAQEKVRALKERFSDWIWSDPERARTLAEFYNEEYNNLVVREYDGDYLTTPGIAATWSWRPHQKRVIARIIQAGNTYMAHSVGAGKTSAMIGAGMEMRRLGLVRKPMYAVPNHMLGQFAKEFYEQYPTARIAVADERRFHTHRRKQFIADVANEDLDAVIITHSAFGMIPISDQFQDGLVQEQIDQYRQLLEEAKAEGGDNRITRSRLEKQIERLEQRLSGRGQKKSDQVFTFEEMGVDFLFMDEAHLFRKLDFATKMSNVKGISPEGSKASWDLFVKTRYLETVNPSRNLVLASGTPVTNTMAELYTVSRYLQPDELRDRSLEHFDAWAGAFGDTVTQLEQNPAGGYQPVTRFAKFVNVPELSNMVRQAMDVVTSRQLEQYVTRPAIKGGQRQMNLAEKSETLDAYQAELAARMEAIAERKGPPSPGDDIILNVINDGRHAAIDMRLVNPDLPNDPGSKLNLLVDNVFRLWQQTKRQPFHAPAADGYSAKPVDKGPAAQMVFANLGLSGKRGFAVPDYVRAELVRRGVPKGEIAFIADHKTHVAKQRLFNDMNEGRVRVLIGSTAKMATGVNAQRRLYAVHNLDPLWFPADDEQRNGRILRQGNMNPEVEVHDYSTKGTYDSTMWGLMETKARFIQGFFEGDPTLRDMEDLGEASQYEQAKAITTADPRLIELTELRQNLEKAQRRKAAFDREQASIEQRVANARNAARRHQERIPAIEADIARRGDVSGEKFRATVDGKTYTDRVDTGDALLGRLDLLKGQDREVSEKIGEIGGFDIVAEAWGETKNRQAALVVRREGEHETEVRVSGSARGLVQSLENVLRGFEGDLNDARDRLQQAEATIREFEPQIGREFTGQAEIDDLTERARALERELAPKQEEKPPADEGDAEGQFALRSAETPRRFGLPAEAGRPIASHRSDRGIKAHRDYRAAKTGDNAAAVRLVGDVVQPETVEEARRRFGSDVVYVPVLSIEADGYNAIPAHAAGYYAEATGAQTARDIVQASTAFHTGARPLERIISRPLFDGPVEAGRRYVLVDDVTVMGGTLAELANHIRANGGEVAGVVTLANASRSDTFTPRALHVRLLENRFGDEIRNLGIEPSALTGPEAGYLAGFKDAEQLRAAVAKAEGSRERRLRAKGILPPASTEGRLSAPSEPEGFTPEFVRDAQRIADALQERLRQVGISDRVALRLRERIQATADGTASEADARYLNRVIEVSLTARDPERALNHEVIHALRDLGVLRDAEWRALDRAARADADRMAAIRQRYQRLGLSEDLLVEEAAAEMYADWTAGRSQAAGFPRRAFERIRDFLRSLGEALRGNGFRTRDSVFRSIERGEVGRRQPRDARGRFTPAIAEAGPTVPNPGPRFALAREEVNDPTAAGGAEARQKGMNQWLGSQPLDQAFRLPWHLLGGINEHGEWNWGLKLSRKTQDLITNATFSEEGRFAWLNPAMGRARAGLLDRYGLDPAYVERERQRGLDERRIMAEVPEIMQRLKEADIGADEANVLQAVLTGEAVADADMAKIAEPIRNAIDDMGAEAVKLGLISAEAFERNRGVYLHRVYQKHESDQGGLARFVARMAGRQRKKIIGNQFKGRGLWIEVDTARLMRRVPGFAGAERGAPVQGERFRVLDKVEHEGQETLRGIDPASRRRVLDRIYLPADAPVPDHLAPDYVDRGTWEVRGSKGGNMVLWRDFTKTERTQMGEITDARYTIGKTYMSMAHDLATGRFFQDIALNEDWSTGTEPRADTWKDAQEYNRFWADPAIEWVRVPDTTIPKSRTKRYGALAGRYVRAEIWRDLHELEKMQQANWWNSLLTQWKLNKTARSPVVHMNNVMSNVVLMDLADVRAIDLAQGITSMIRQDQDYQEARDNGAFGADMVSQEIRNNVLQPVLEEIQQDVQGGRETMEAKIGMVGKLADAIWSRGKNLDRKMVNLYRLEDEVFRMATYKRKRHLGFDPAESALQARDQFLNYDIRAPWVNAARRSVLPFISYTYRAVPVVAHSVALRPWKLAKYATIAYAVNALSYMVDAGDEDEERRSLREHETGNTWIGSPRMIRMPWSDDYGNPVFLDVRRWVPAGDVFDMNQGHSAFPVPAPLQFGGPLMLGAELMLNKQAFTGNEITNDRTDDWWDKSAAIGDWAWKSWMPSAAWVPGSWYWERIGNAMTGARDFQGRPYQLEQAVPSAFGVKLKPQDVQEAFFWKGVEFDRIERELKSQLRRLGRDHERGLVSRRAKERRERRVIEKLERLGQERQRTFEGAEP